MIQIRLSFFVLHARPVWPLQGRAKGEFDLYSGSLIQELLASVEKAEQVATDRCSKDPSELAAFSINSEAVGMGACPEFSPATFQSSEPEQFTQSLGLRPADWNLALLLIIHAQLVRALKPGHDLANSIHINQVGAVSAPEQSLVQAAE